MYRLNRCTGGSISNVSQGIGKYTTIPTANLVPRPTRKTESSWPGNEANLQPQYNRCSPLAWVDGRYKVDLETESDLILT